MSPQLRS